MAHGIWASTESRAMLGRLSAASFVFFQQSVNATDIESNHKTLAFFTSAVTLIVYLAASRTQAQARSVPDIFWRDVAAQLGRLIASYVMWEISHF